MEFNFFEIFIEYLVGLSNISIGCSEERHNFDIIVLYFLNVISTVIIMHFLLLLKLQNFRTVTPAVIIYFIAPYQIGKIVVNNSTNFQLPANNPPF